MHPLLRTDSYQNRGLLCWMPNAILMKGVYIKIVWICCVCFVLGREFLWDGRKRCLQTFHEPRIVFCQNICDLFLRPWAFLYICWWGREPNVGALHSFLSTLSTATRISSCENSSQMPLMLWIKSDLWLSQTRMCWEKVTTPGSTSRSNWIKKRRYCQSEIILAGCCQFYGLAYGLLFFN